MTESAGAVLVIDDNPENRALAQAILDDEGYRVILASSGDQGLAMFAADRPDCVLLDIRMPGMDGITACRRLRELPGGMDVPILFLTAQRDVETFDRAQDAGGDDYLTKPVRPTELVSRMRSAIKLRRLAAERGELFELVRRQRDDLLRLQLQKEQLAAFLVHDLKNPVHSIELHTQRILRDTSATERSRDAGLRIQDEGRALLRMIMNLLDLSRADEGRLTANLQQLVVADLLEEVASMMRIRAQSSQVKISVETEPGLELTCDVDLIRRVVENLVDNALRHAPEESAIRVAATREADGTVLRIADAGAGVPEDQRERVFERFARNEGLDPQTGRTNRGLGLAFCKLAATAHNGRIWIEDAHPGAAFCVWIPNARE